MKYIFFNQGMPMRPLKMDGLDDYPNVPAGYVPAAYGPSEEVWRDSMKNLVKLTARTIREYNRPFAYSSKHNVHTTLYGGSYDNGVGPTESLKDDVRRKSKYYNVLSGYMSRFLYNDFYRTFEHWCEYYGDESKGNGSYGQLVENDDFIKEWFDGVEKVFEENNYFKD